MIASVPPMIARGSFRCGSFTSPPTKRQVAESVVRPEHADQRQAEHSRPYWSRRSPASDARRAAVGAAKQQRARRRSRAERANFAAVDTLDDRGAEPGADDVGGGGEGDGAPPPALAPRSTCAPGRSPSDAEQYSPKTIAMPPSADARISDELRPAEQERRRPSPALAQIGVEPAGLAAAPRPARRATARRTA